MGVDIGGTFTDIVAMRSDGHVAVRKVPSNSQDYALSVVDGLTEALAAGDLATRQVLEILHGTTVASNTILERKGARTGLITTKGFRDTLEIRTLRMPRLYDLHWEKPAPLVERYLRLAVDERIDASGRVRKPLDPSDAERVVEDLLTQGVETIAVCLLHSYLNPVHEKIIKQIIVRRAPTVACCISSEVLPEIREYERTSTTVINAYVMPAISGYLDRLGKGLANSGYRAPLLLMQSNGSLMRAEAAAKRPMHIIESGPVAGVIGVQKLARKIGIADVISFDMGGTTAKASLIENGEVSRTAEYQVGSGVMAGSRLLNGAGYCLKVPAIDLAEVGAGGGSIIRVDAAGVMQVGPESAGAVPGPACYNTGGNNPTLTDANVLLGYVNPQGLAGGTVRLHADCARHALERSIAAPLGLTVADAAYGAYQIAVANMIRAVKAISTERGRDPRQHTLVAFGGNGPIFAVSIARELGIRHIVIPPSPGLFSSFGLLFAQVAHYTSRSWRGRLDRIELAELSQAWAALERGAIKQLEESGYSSDTMQLRYGASLHYQGQSYELSVELRDRPRDRSGLTALGEAFAAEHERIYGHRAGRDEPVELVNIQVVGQVESNRVIIPEYRPVRLSESSISSRPVYFGPAHGWLSTPILGRSGVATLREGPIVIEEYDSTCLIPPGARGYLDDCGDIRIEAP